jgi:hypothetical protein
MQAQTTLIVPSPEEFAAMSCEERHAFNAAFAAAAHGACGCPDDCNCRCPWRVNYCGCKAHR